MEGNSTWKVRGKSICRAADNYTVDTGYLLFCTSPNTAVFYISKNKNVIKFLNHVGRVQVCHLITRPSSTGHIRMGSFMGRGDQYIQFVKVLYCKLPTSSKQL